MKFSDVIGHKQIKQRLIQHVNQKRIGHAQLFLGTNDTGALALALAFAGYIQCRDRGEQDACGKCPACLKMDKLIHPDLHFFFPTAPNQEHKKDVSSKLFMARWREQLLDSPYFTHFQWLNKLGVENKQAFINAEDCNDIIRALGVKSYESPYRIVLIYMVEKLFYAAAPKLLKVLEEPPGNTLFLMVSENRDRILNTILSRTQVIKLPLPDEASLVRTLVERYGVEAKTAQHLAFLTGGALSESLRIYQQDEEQLADFESFREWMRSCYKGDAARIIKWVESTAQSGREKQKSFFQYGLKMFRMCLLNNYGAGELIRIEGEEEDFIHKFSPFVNHGNALQIVDSFNQGILHLERNANAKILFTDLSFTLHRLMHQSA